MTRQIPMLFSPAMVNALLAGRKTETRRILRPQPETYQNDTGQTCDIYPFKVDGQTRSRIASGFGGSGVITTQECRAEIGDLIWVKEMHYAYGYWRTIPGAFTKKTGKPKREFVRVSGIQIMFDEPSILKKDHTADDMTGWYKRPSLFITMSNSRLTLRVTSYAIERLQEITNLGAIAEGATPAEFVSVKAHRVGYSYLWNTINGPDAWAENPLVDVTKFDVIHQNVQELVKS